MQQPSPEEFAGIVLRSGLVEEAAWERWYAQNAAGWASSEQMARSLVAAGLITPWQSERLLVGRWKGFFLGKYKILGQLGAGAMGAVFLAEHTVMRHRVAIKVMASRYHASTRHMERFQREARATAAVAHPRIVRAFDVEISGQTPYLVMEYVDGDDLQKMVQQSGALPVRDAAEYARQAAEGLHAAHQAGLVHRDVKPANLLVDKEGQVHILDLGLARMEVGDEASLTMLHNSKALGTVDYLAPEQALDSHAVDARADIYSLGCTLYFLLAGSPPFNEGSIAQRILAHQTKQPKDLHQCREEIPKDLAAIVGKMLAKDRAKRFQTAADVAAALQAFLAGKSLGASLGLSSEEEDLLRIDLEDAGEVPVPATAIAPAAPIARPAPAMPAAPQVPAATVAKSSSGVVSTKGSSGGSSGSGEGSGSGAHPILPPLNPPDLFPPSGSDVLLGSLGSSPLQPIPAPGALDTLSGLLDATQPLSIPPQGSPLIPLAAPAQTTSGLGSVRQSFVQAVAEKAEQGEGIGGLRYKLWFLILFGMICGLIVAGIGYSVWRTVHPQAEVQQNHALER